ncbi:MAG TPA: DNA-3-methyladenine glycosylase 2 family protein [Armatimonadota bacterium]|nr:DNA-3-methyladenine glycosylase 2 family protein [Armatimonadota bacterium]
MGAFLLEPAPPFRLDLTVWALRRRPHNVVDRWDGETYRRTLTLSGVPVEVAVIQTGPLEAPRLRVTTHGAPLRFQEKQVVTEALERMLGCRIDLAEFYSLARGDAELGPLAQRFRGMKPPRFPSVFEGVVNGIACQQLTLTLGIHLLNRLAENYGLATADNSGHAFPRPEDLGHVTPEMLRALGLSGQKSRAILELGRLGAADMEHLTPLSDEEALVRLLKLRGVGRWTAEYVLLRSLGRLQVFPGDDVGARNSLQRWLGLTVPQDYTEVGRILARWQPYQGLVYLHLLLNGLMEAGHLQDTN